VLALFTVYQLSSLLATSAFYLPSSMFGTADHNPFTL